MPRMRILKPDFWSDKNMVKLSPYARLLYLGMWNFALCDRGHLPDDIEELQLKILPRDPVDPEQLLDELLKLDRVRRMDDGAGGTYLWVPRLSDHQKVDPRWKTRCPYCSETPARSSRPAETPRNSPESRSGSPRLPETQPVVELKVVELKGVDTKVDEGSTGAAMTVTTGRHSRDLEEPPKSDSQPGVAEKIITRWSESLTRRPQQRIVDDISRHVVAALHDGCDPDEVGEALTIWQQRGNLGPAVLPLLIHEITNRGPSAPGTNVVPFIGRASPVRPSTTDQRVSDALAAGAAVEARLSQGGHL